MSSLRFALAIAISQAACRSQPEAPFDMALEMAVPGDGGGNVDGNLDLRPPLPPPPIVPPTCGDWAQGGHDEAHSGVACATGQTLGKSFASQVFDPFVLKERAEEGGDIAAHYQAPLVVGDDVYMEFKSGLYRACNPPGSGMPAPCGPDALDTQTWNEKRLHWNGTTLDEIWSFASDWKPAPLSGWEPVFQPVIVDDVIYVPAAGGTLWKLDRKDGKTLARINPFGTTVDLRTFVSGGLTASAAGDVYYTVIQLHSATPAEPDSWLVRVAPSGASTLVTFHDLVPGAPAANDDCQLTYASDVPQPWPPPADPDGGVPLPLTGTCGAQRAALNAAPAIGPDGTLFVVSTAHFNSRYGYVIAVGSDLKPRWATSLRGLLHDGCGVLVPTDDTPEHCSAGATQGVDPSTNDAPAGLVDDASSSSPVALPDGGVLYGALTFYNGFRGHLIKLDGNGQFKGSYDFGWDTTPAVRVHDSTYSIIIKDNHYLGDGTTNEGPFYITQLDANLAPEWKFASTNTMNCHRDTTGKIVCVDDHPNGFEWCVNSIAVDQGGVIYANSEDGNVYAIRPDGTERERLFLDLAVGAAYTPLALGRGGLVHALNDGKLAVVGQ